MASSQATNRNRTTRSRLPLTPKVTSSRRGASRSATPAKTENTGVFPTPAMHITPNAGIVARGDVRSSRYREQLRESAQDLRRFRA